MRRLLHLLPLLTGLVACTAVAPPEPVTTSADSADQVIFGMATDLSNESNIRLSQVEADTAWYYQNTGLWDMRQVKITFFDSAGRVQSVVTSRRGTLRNVGQDVVLDARDHVVAITPGGDTLRTPHLVYDKHSNNVYSDSAYTQKSGTTTSNGTQFYATPDFKDVRIGKPKGQQLPPAAVKKKSPVTKKPIG